MNLPRALLGLVLLGSACATATATAPASAPPGATAPAHETSVKPGINDDWRSPAVAPLIARLESESREIYVHRERLMDVIAPREGTVVADVGAGSGLLTLLLARRVGEAGKVLAIDINPALLARIRTRAQDLHLTNVETRLSPEDRTPLTPGTVDLVLLCDAYHHFEYPRTTLRSLYEGLRPGGELVLVDFDRVPGKLPPALLEHVRAGKEVFTAEIRAAGFELVREHEVRELTQNYVLRFRRPRG